MLFLCFHLLLFYYFFQKNLDFKKRKKRKLDLRLLQLLFFCLFLYGIITFDLFVANLTSRYLSDYFSTRVSINLSVSVDNLSYGSFILIRTVYLLNRFSQQLISLLISLLIIFIYHYTVQHSALYLRSIVAAELTLLLILANEINSHSFWHSDLFSSWARSLIWYAPILPFPLLLPLFLTEATNKSIRCVQRMSRNLLETNIKNCMRL